jgi:hypothetical protein
MNQITNPNRVPTHQHVTMLWNYMRYAIAGAVSDRLPTAVACDQAQVRSCFICDARSNNGAGFLLQIPIQPTASHSLFIVSSGAL